MKNKNFLFPLALFAFCLVSVFFGRTAEAVSGAGGLWGQYSKNYTNSEFVEVKVENVDFDNFDQILNDRIGQASDADVIWRGGVYAEREGKYGIRLYNYGGYIQRLYVGGSSLGSSVGEISKTVSLKKGWNKFVIFYKVSSSKPDSALRLFWTPPGETEEIIPKENLGYKFWSDKILTIPSGEEKKRLDYIAAGAGTRGKTEVSVEVDMPENVLDDEVWFIFYKAPGGSNQIEIKNETVGSGYVSVSGTENLNFMGLSVEYPEVYGRIPASLIDDDGSGKMKLKFRKTDGWGDGVSMIVPFEDPDTSKPEGKISIRLVAATAYRGASPVMTFPIEDTGEDKTINPLFISPNGETKIISGYRPNYLVMLSGSGSAPKETDTLIDLTKMPGTKMIVPQESPINKSNSKTWYPVYGRDGEQLDVVSSRAANPDGKINPITIPAGHTWIAFQYYGSNHSLEPKKGNGESASITGGGLFSEKAIDEFKLEVNVSGAGKVVSDDGIIDCPSVKCEHKYVFGTDVKLTAIPDPGNNFLPGWSGDCSGTDNDCNVFIDSEKNINAGFSPVATLGGICGGADGGSFCNEPLAKCHLGYAIDEAFDSVSSSWTWKCRYNDINSPVCSATRNCAIREITP